MNVTLTVTDAQGNHGTATVELTAPIATTPTPVAVPSVTAPAKIKTSKYGWKPQLPDHRDKVLAPVKVAVPTSIDLRTSGFMPPVYDQGDLGSCVANSTAAAFEYDLRKQRLTSFTPSRLFIYYNGRVLEGTVSTDSGLMVRDGLKVVNKQGVCSEAEWPYTDAQLTVDPTAQCYTDALKSKSTSYQSVSQNLTNIKNALASGYPVVFGFTVYESFESDAVTKTGVVPMPSKSESVLGGHSVCLIGYNDATQRFICRNSWGTSWGQQGYFTMPYAYITNTDLAGDFWVIKAVS